MQVQESERGRNDARILRNYERRRAEPHGEFFLKVFLRRKMGTKIIHMIHIIEGSRSQSGPYRCCDRCKPFFLPELRWRLIIQPPSVIIFNFTIVLSSAAVLTLHASRQEFTTNRRVASLKSVMRCSLLAMGMMRGAETTGWLRTGA